MFETVETEDGSISIRDPATGELHHNRAGAYAEARVNYIQPSGLLSGWFANQRNLKVLDVCFGLGYNTLVLLAELAALPRPLFDEISVVAIENDPEVLKVIERVVLSEKFRSLQNASMVGTVVSTFGKSEIEVRMGTGSSKVSIDLRNADLRSMVPQIAREFGGEFDLVFHDPFSPKHVPELWTVDLFRCYHTLLNKDHGLVLTYSSAGAVRGGLSEAGFHLRRTTALGGKSGGTMGATNAVPENSFLFPLSDEESAKLRSASAVPYRDPSFNTSRQDILSRRLSEQEEFKRTQPP